MTYAEACSQLLESGDYDSRELAGVLRDIANEAERAGKIIRRIRGFISKHEPRFRLINLNELVRETIHLVALDPNWQSVQFRLETDSSEPRVRADPVTIEQVILNLVHNAIDAMEELPEEQRQLCLRTQAHADKYVEVSVEDRGAGLHPKVRKHLFEPFSTTKKNGMGMGLAISRSIVQQHGGNLWATDNPYGGTTFRFTLPQNHASAHHLSA
jgi:C4-dicarboxylate-specific signal transduction histidine kinase